MPGKRTQWVTLPLAQSFAGPSSKCKCRGPCSTIIRSFKKKVIMAEHLTGPGPVRLPGSDAHEASPAGTTDPSMMLPFLPRASMGSTGFPGAARKGPFITTSESTLTEGFLLPAPFSPGAPGRVSCPSSPPALVCPQGMWLSSWVQQGRLALLSCPTFSQHRLRNHVLQTFLSFSVWCKHVSWRQC